MLMYLFKGTLEFFYHGSKHYEPIKLEQFDLGQYCL